MIHNKFALDLGWCRVAFDLTDVISDEVFVWAEEIRRPTKKDLRDAARYIQAIPQTFYLYANVDATRADHMRFAEFFGFREVRRSGNIAIMVWEKDRCKLSSSH